MTHAKAEIAKLELAKIDEANDAFNIFNFRRAIANYADFFKWRREIEVKFDKGGHNMQNYSDTKLVRTIFCMHSMGTAYHTDITFRYAGRTKSG